MSTIEPNTAENDVASVVMISETRFLFGCAVLAAALFAAGRVVTLPLGLLAGEVFATILGLFLFGSFRYQIHKNALTYGMLLVIVATFCGLATSQWHRGNRRGRLVDLGLAQSVLISRSG